MLHRIPIGVKATAAIGGALLVAAAAQFFLIRWALDEEVQRLRTKGVDYAIGAPAGAHVRPALALAVTLPLVIASVGSGLTFAWMARRRAAPLVGALRRVAAGDFAARLPPAPDPEFVVVREAFDAMGGALRELTSSLQYADAQRRRLFADLAHELATPVSSVLGILEALERPELCRSDEERAHLLRTLEHEVTRLERLIRDVRELAYLDDPDVRLEPERADVAAAAERVAKRMSAGSRARIVCDAAPSFARIDVTRIEQVFVNLLANALRYTPDDGTIRVAVQAREGSVRAVVEDSGAGVPDELLPRLGERLLRADPSRDRATGGHGLGLSIVSAIVHKHGGKVAFSRSELGGLRVAIELAACA
jgi:two-component system sensor histidine kinase BaeS